MFKTSRLIFTLVFLLSACSSNRSAPPPTGPVSNTGTPAATQISVQISTATATEAVFATPTEESTATSSLTVTVTPTASATATMSATATESVTPTPDVTATASQTPTVTATPTRTLPPTPTITPTFDYPDVTVTKQANCRYGPGTAYLYRWGLYPGDKAEVHGRNWSGTWFWIKPENLDSHCWASEIVFEIQGDKMSVPVIPPRLPKTTFAGPPGNVQAVREENQVVVTWDPVILSDDKRRGYLLEVSVCQNSVRVPMIVHTDDTRYEFQDDSDCSGESSGLLYTAEKHGYSDPVQIPWP